MCDTTVQDCNCCGIETDCINGLCELCSEYNDKLQKQRDWLLSTVRNALVSLAIIHMPVQEDNLANVATNEELLKVMADSFREAIAKTK